MRPSSREASFRQHEGCANADGQKAALKLIHQVHARIAKNKHEEEAHFRNGDLIPYCVPISSE